MQTLQKLSGIISEISTRRLRSSKRFGLIVGVLTIAFIETHKVRFKNLTRFVSIPLKILTRRIKICKPRSKRMQYIILLSIAYVTKYLTRLEVFPDDLDKFLNHPVSSSQSSRELISQNFAQTQARFIKDPHN